MATAARAPRPAPAPAEQTSTAQTRTSIDPRAAALLLRWGLRHASLCSSVERPEGALATVAHVLAPALTSTERALVVVEAARCLEAAQRVGDVPCSLSPCAAQERVDAWQALIDRLVAEGGEGSARPIRAWWGERGLARTSQGAIRLLTRGVGLGGLTPEEIEAIRPVSVAVAACAREHSPRDRVALLRELERGSRAAEALDRPFSLAWCALYERLRAMPLDEAEVAAWSLPALIKART